MTTVDLTPNFGNLRKQFERSATLLAGNIARRMKTEGEIDASDVRNLMVFLNIALTAIDSTEALIEFREEFDKMSSQIVAANDAFNGNGEVS